MKLNLFYPILFFLAVIATFSSGIAQVSQSSQAGVTSKFSVTVTNQSGVQSSATMTPEFDVSTRAKLIVGENSSSQQAVNDPTASLNSSGVGSSNTSASGSASGAYSSTVLNYGKGSEYLVEITPRTLADGEKRGFTGTAEGRALGFMTNSLSIESTNSSFLNSFTSSF